MPVFRGFSEVKGVKIPKIVTYHTTVKTMFMHRFGAIFRRGKTGSENVPNGVASSVMQQMLRQCFESGFSEREKEKKQAVKNGFEHLPKQAPKRHSKAGVGEVCRVIGFEKEYASKRGKTESWLPYYI